MELTATQKAERRAWIMVRKNLGSEEKYRMLRRGEPVEIQGNLGGRYILYPNGHLVRLDKSSPVVGKALKTTSMPYPDVLATMIAWIKHDEKRLIDNWGCGSIRVSEDTENEDIPAMHTDDFNRELQRQVLRIGMRRHRTPWYKKPENVFIIIIPAILVWAAYIMLGNIQSIPQGADSTLNGTLSQYFSQISSWMPIILMAAVLMMIVYVVTRMTSWR